MIKVAFFPSYFWTFRSESVGKKLGYGDGSQNLTNVGVILGSVLARHTIFLIFSMFVGIKNALLMV